MIVSAIQCHGGILVILSVPGGGSIIPRRPGLEFVARAAVHANEPFGVEMQALKTVHLYTAGALLAIPISVAAVLAGWRQLYLAELTLGWTLVLINAGCAYRINRYAIRVKARDSCMWGLGMNGIRTALLFGSVVFIYFLEINHFYPFLTVTLIGYFMMTGCEVLALHSESLVPPGCNS